MAHLITVASRWPGVPHAVLNRLMLCSVPGVDPCRPSDGKDCILTLLSGQLSLICGSPEDPDLQELLQQLHDTNGISESDSDCEDAAGSGSSLSGRTGAGGMAAAGTTTAGHGARVSTACFEIQSCHWGDFLVQAERRSASPSPPPRSSSSSPVGGASSSPRTKDVSGSSRSVQSSGPLLPAGGPRFKQATRTVTFGRPRQQQPSSLGGHKEEVEQPKRGLWYRVKKVSGIVTVASGWHSFQLAWQQTFSQHYLWLVRRSARPPSFQAQMTALAYC
jgi:hypothetical protein